MITIPGYDLYRQDRTQKKGGGVAILISNKLRHCARQDLSSKLDESAIGVVHDTFPHNMLTEVYAGVDICYEQLCQSTEVAEDAAIQPCARQVSPKLQQVC